MADVQHSPSLELELPNKLLLEIMIVLKGNSQALTSMIRSCKRLKAFAQPFLYESITITRGLETQAAYLVRTLLEKPAYTSQIGKIGLSLNMLDGKLVNHGSANTVGILQDPSWIANTLKHFQGFDGHHMVKD